MKFCFSSRRAFIVRITKEIRLAGKIGNGNRSTTIIQPVPLGNPPSNSEIPDRQTQQQVPVVPVVQQRSADTGQLKNPKPGVEIKFRSKRFYRRKISNVKLFRNKSEMQKHEFV